jgi:cyclopropane fatty-acyl-phospholipid synthase-like methyltransferase
MMRTISVVGQEVWEQGYEGYALNVSKDPVMNDFIRRYIPHRRGDLLEIGCFPGRYLPILASMGYTPSGVDLTPRVRELPGWLESMGIVAGSFLQVDFGSFSPKGQYDAVVSFGFVEHFSNWKAVFEKQCDLVTAGGVVCATFPNFKGIVQKYLHVWLDAENLRNHHLPAMNPSAYAEICRMRGWEIIFSGCFGGFDFWVNAAERSRFQKKIINVLLRMAQYGTKMPSCQMWAPYAGVIAKRPTHDE